MSTTIEKYEALKKKVDNLTQSVEQAKGQHALLLKQMKEKFGCDDLQSARKHLKKLEKDAAAAKRTFEDALETLENDWEEDLVDE